MNSKILDLFEERNELYCKLETELSKPKEMMSAINNPNFGSVVNSKMLDGFKMDTSFMTRISEISEMISNMCIDNYHKDLYRKMYLSIRDENYLESEKIKIDIDKYEKENEK